MWTFLRKWDNNNTLFISVKNYITSVPFFHTFLRRSMVIPAAEVRAGQVPGAGDPRRALAGALTQQQVRSFSFREETLTKDILAFRSYRGRASFVCPFGRRLTGRESIECGHDGRWDGDVPVCEGERERDPSTKTAPASIAAIQCPSPLPPRHGRLIESGRSYVGYTVQYVCDEGFVLIGEPLIRCTERGIWSHATPFCKRACRFPGDPRRGRLTPVKFLYEIGDRVLVQCKPGKEEVAAWSHLGHAVPLFRLRQRRAAEAAVHGGRPVVGQGAGLHQLLESQRLNNKSDCVYHTRLAKRDYEGFLQRLL